MKYDFIIFEGIDRVGKTSTKKFFEFQTNFKYVCVDRLLVTSIAYETLKNRNNDIEQLYKIFNNFIENFNVLYIYLRVDDTSIVEKRIEDENEDVLVSSEASSLIKIYDDFFNENKNVNVFIKNVEECNSQEDFKNVASEIILKYNL